ECHGAKSALRGVVVDFNAAVVAIAHERRPTRERIADRTGELRLLRQLPLRGDEPALQRSELRAGARLANATPVIRRLTADLLLDVVKLTDAVKRPVGDWRVGRNMDVVELAAQLRPLRRVLDYILPVGFIEEPIEARVRVHLHYAAEGLEVLRRLLALAIRRVREPRRGRRLVRGRPIIAHVYPQPPLLRRAPAGIEHRNRRVVRMQLIGAEHVPGKCLDERPQQRARFSDPVCQRRAAELDAFPSIDLRLAVQWQVIAIFRDEHMSKEPGAGEPLRNRPARRGRLHDLRTTTARELRPHMTDYAQLTRNVLEHLRDVLAKRLQRAAALRARTRHLVRDGLSRQVFWK